MNKMPVDPGNKSKPNKDFETGQEELKLQLDKVIKELNIEREREQELTTKLKKLESELKNARVMCQKAVRERDRIKRLYAQIEQSRTWRYTLPVRKLASIFKCDAKGKSSPHRMQSPKPAVAVESTKLLKYERQSVEPGSKPLTQKEKKAAKKISQLKFRLYNLGFTERALADLQSLFQQTNDSCVKRLAAWELVLWYANQYSEAGAQRCLDLLPGALQGEKSPGRLRQAAIIEAECHEILGNKEAAKETINNALELNPHADLFLARTNLETDMKEKVNWINKALALHGISAISYDDSLRGTALDCLRPGHNARRCTEIPSDAPKVTVIVPVYNAEGTIKTALDSITSQTWSNLEIIVVDDHSTDATTDIVEEYVKRDNRTQLIKAESNGGPYVARNLALRAATGEFVTCHDADDWSHPEKIERQVRYLLNNPSIIGNSSQQARVFDDLKPYRRGNPGYYIFNNMSSFMFRRIPVMNAVGYWDCVRFGADSEFIRRIKKVFGENTVVEVSTGPLTFQRQSRNSLTGDGAFGYHGFFMGARKEYFESHEYYHSIADSLRYDFPQKFRPFAVPEPMWPIREVRNSERRHFDVILVSDFRLDGGSNMSNVEEIKAQKRMGLYTGLIQMSRYDYYPRKKINPKIRQLLDGNQVQMIVYGEKLSCDVLILRYPPVLQEWQRYIPNVKAKDIRVIVNQTPMSDYGPGAVLRYDIKRCHKHLLRYFGKGGIWHPISPLVREALNKHHAKELEIITLSDEDWINIIDVDEWRRPSRPSRGAAIRIGRHARDSILKWPADGKELLAVYPDSTGYEIHVLGGAGIPEKILGYLPKNWRVLEFGEMHPKDFLAMLDVFVYYTHPDLVEAFGRVIIEAMAVGVPVILPPKFREVFGEAAIYAEPAEVKEKIDSLMSNDDYYQSQVEKAWAYVKKHFGYSKHAARLGIKKNLEVPIKAGGKVSLKSLQDLPRYKFNWPILPAEFKKGAYSFSWEGLEYDFIYLPAPVNRLFVLLTGAVDRSKTNPPVFHRWSWASYFPGHCLYIADPTLKLYKDINVAWYIGTLKTDVISIIAQLIIDVAGKLNMPLGDVIIYASSAGGFAALKLSSIIPDIVVVAINPQIDVTQYKNKSVDKYLSYCFDGIDRTNAIINYPERFSIIPFCNKIKNNKVVYVQNRLDKHHYHTHFKLFNRAIGLNAANNYRINNIKAIFFEHEDGHRKAEPPELFPTIIETAIGLSRSDL
ncbi:glycosyltransferase [Desulfallas thermosapovorans]|uniref:Glycosyl transferase family 1 n=1 Tax=Desulfallas thermosapovorans DSM 6562 TaxID=1121431 RepID=A0A5S4ZVK6_9FIRM|nr:glycosyltransferase [Desulfallas thermosapovorans]TYO96888.1 glycosyl transferase family 1 [Desulfallas thermosapovorans DSM 6562]